MPSKLAVPDDLKFQGEKQDLEEMLGNLLDNACKWAANSVSLSVSLAPERGGGSSQRIALVVEDDGPGLTEEQRREALKRGKRLDESKPGSGLGLSIVTDLASLYGGTLELGRSKRGWPGSQIAVAERLIRLLLLTQLGQLNEFPPESEGLWFAGLKVCTEVARLDASSDAIGRRQ